MKIKAERIKQRRKELHIPVEILANKVGRNKATIYRYESGAVDDVPYEIAVKLAKSLNVSISYLQGNANNKQSWEDIIQNINTYPSDVHTALLALYLNKDRFTIDRVLNLTMKEMELITTIVNYSGKLTSEELNMIKTLYMCYADKGEKNE